MEKFRENALNRLVAPWVFLFMIFGWPALANAQHEPQREHPEFLTEIEASKFSAKRYMTCRVDRFLQANSL